MSISVLLYNASAAMSDTKQMLRDRFECERAASL